jgi:hypothetical protein
LCTALNENLCCITYHGAQLDMPPKKKDAKKQDDKKNEEPEPDEEEKELLEKELVISYLKSKLGRWET